MRHPHVFITPAILKAYINLQTALYQPSSFPDIFTLYASKPNPTLSNTNTITFKPSNPRAVKAAVPSPVASTALTAALKSYNLPLSISIINTTYSQPAFLLTKTLRPALLPPFSSRSPP